MDRFRDIDNGIPGTGGAGGGNRPPRRGFGTAGEGSDAFGGRVPPQNIEAEIAVLGAMMLGERGAVERASELISRDDFYRDAHGQIFDGMLHLAEKDEPVDIITLKDELGRRGVLENIGGIGYLMQLGEFVPTTANLHYHAQIVRDKALLRRLIEAASRIAGMAYGEVDEVDTVVDMAERAIFEVARKRSAQGFMPLRPLLNEAFEQVDVAYHEKGMITGLDTGFEDFNYMTSGFQDGDLIIIAARPSMGKCVKWDNWIVDPATGDRVTIKEAVERKQKTVFRLGDDGAIGVSPVSGWVDSGVQSCWRVTTRTGRFVEVTGHHPFLTGAGWTPLHDITPGMAIAVTRTPLASAGRGNVVGDRFEHPGQLLPGAKEAEYGARHRQDDCLPREIGRYIGARLAERGWYACELARRVGEDVDAPHVNTNPHAPYLFDREQLARIAGVLGDDDLCPAASTDVYWDEIVSIEPIGEHSVYDLSVPDGANFIAQDIFVHNTSLAVGIGQNVALKAGPNGERKTVALFSLEMSREQLVQRMICSEARVDAHKLRTGFLQDDDWDRLAGAIQRLWDANIFIDDTTDMGPLEMRAKCRRLRAEQGLDLVIVDYLQLMRGSGRSNANRNEEITEISRGLKNIAREMRVPVIALAQLSRAVERREDKRPMLSDLRDSGSIEAEADLVSFIYRPAYYERKQEIRADDGSQGGGGGDGGRPGEYEGEEAEVIIAKHRNGPVGTVKVSFLARFARFDNLANREDSPF